MKITERYGREYDLTISKDNTVKYVKELVNYIEPVTAYVVISVCEYKGINYIVVCQKKQLEEMECVYLIVRDTVIHYIGYSENVKSRFVKHKKYQKGDVIVCLQNNLWEKTLSKRFEKALVCLVQPEGNDLSKFDRIN